jgi:hypothetical protein
VGGFVGVFCWCCGLHVCGQARGTAGLFELLTAETTNQYEWLALHNGGYCVAAAAKSELPTVLPVNRALGTLQYDGR